MPNTESNPPDAAILTESPLPPAREKLADALSRILEYKDFNSITNAEISREAGVNESLIYRYFENKRGLLHQVLHDYMLDFQAQVQQDLKSSQGALDKLRSLIQVHIRMYDSNRVLARILLLEVRNFPGYFESETYQLVQTYGRLVMQIIREGMANDEIRDDVAPARVRDLILGSIEHFCMAPVIFGHEIDSGAGASQLGALIFSGIEKKADGAG
ncbi:MAG: TetR/AcrR family transcriptional regulator [Desulfobacterales bacterium]|nr:TetR/AcrR family transcriptional regulator [Desulfobacterales bacterium]